MNRTSCWLPGALILTSLSGCGSADAPAMSDSGSAEPTQSTALAECQTQLSDCEQLASRLHYADTVFTSSTSVPA